MGDAGNAFAGLSPALTRMAGEAERWSAALARDSAVRVVFLGDNVYPSGVRDRDDDDFGTDSLHLQAQVDVVSGPMSMRYRTVAHFLAGNHDWAQGARADGLARLRNQEELLDALHAGTGTSVGLVPTAGEAGPVAVDVGRHVRLVFIDTHWWLLAHDEAVAAEILARLERILSTRGDRRVVVAAHHPFVSGGAHGRTAPVWEGLGMMGLLNRTGALVQDLTSPPYRELLAGLRDVFGRVGAPLVFAAGHDHNLQVIEGSGPEEPRWTLVSGSGSKLSNVADVPGMRLGMGRTGYMRLTVLVDGSVLLDVEASRSVPVCAPEEPVAGTCMAAALSGFRTVFAARLR
jgi:hypothetical protein